MSTAWRVAGGSHAAPRSSWTPRWVTAAAWSVGIALIASGCATAQAPVTASKDLPAFSQVDEGLYRGAQPSPEGLRQLARMGVKTVINLRQPSGTMEKERRLVEQLNMRWVNLPMWFWWRPSDQQIRRFLAVATTDPAQRPVFVHCRQGWNRAGIMVAVYRVVRHGWTPPASVSGSPSPGARPLEPREPAPPLSCS